MINVWTFSGNVPSFCLAYTQFPRQEHTESEARKQRLCTQSEEHYNIQCICSLSSKSFSSAFNGKWKPLTLSGRTGNYISYSVPLFWAGGGGYKVEKKTLQMLIKPSFVYTSVG
jgi:hypothetical protein